MSADYNDRFPGLLVYLVLLFGFSGDSGDREHGLARLGSYNGKGT